MPMTADDFAHNEYRDYVTYQALAGIETVPQFKKILEELIQHEWGDFQFWRQRASRKEFRISPWFILWVRLMRKVLGLTFTAKFLEGNERKAVENYTDYLKTVQEEEIRQRIQAIIEHERRHEKEMIQQVREERVQFIGSLVLGINDALIELTGALVGFTFALRSHRLVALTGLVTGLAASLSMASSAYMQARHEDGKDPKKAALYTGLSYAVVVFLMILPFFVVSQVFAALVFSLVFAFFIITFVAYYTSVLFDRSFTRQLRQMVTLSLGVALIAFLIGSFLRALIGVEKV